MSNAVCNCTFFGHINGGEEVLWSLCCFDRRNGMIPWSGRLLDYSCGHDSFEYMLSIEYKQRINKIRVIF